MTGSALATVALAGQTLWAAGNLGAASRRVDRTDTTEALIWLAVAVGIITVVCLVIRVATVMQRRRRYNSHASLFSGLCRTHGLDRAARGLLKQVARQHKLAHPARLFTEPKWLNPSELQGPLRRRAPEVAVLRNRLFA